MHVRIICMLEIYAYSCQKYIPVRNIKYACQNHDFCVNFPKYAAAILTRYFLRAKNYRIASLYQKQPLVVLNSFPKFTGKRLCWSLFYIKLQASCHNTIEKEAPAQVLTCKHCVKFQELLFQRTLPHDCFHIAKKQIIPTLSKYVFKI